MGENSTWTKTQLAVFFVVILLSIDEINPVKVFLHVFPSVREWQVAAVAVALSFYIFISDLKALLYFGVKIFFHSILSIFFRHVHVVGREHIPEYGPVLFTVNHANQFMDAVMVVCTTRRQVSYLMAEASWKRRVIGDLAWALGVVPVKRAQDDAKAGSGTIRLSLDCVAKQEDDDKEIKDDLLRRYRCISVSGDGTKFTDELKVGDKIRPPGTAFGFKVVTIESDTSMTVDGMGLPDDFPMELFGPTTSSVTYDLLKHTPLSTVFEKVLDRLAGNGAVGIFPEGGSHDRTDLLPLKVGISLIAYSALEENGINVPIVPVGLNYYRAHRWRGRAVVEYGRPIHIDPSTLGDFTSGDSTRRRKVCNALLEEVENAMRSVIVSAPDFETLSLIHTARRLYQRRDSGRPQVDATAARQDLSRRFTEGYKKLVALMTEKDGNALNVSHTESMALRSRIVAYGNELKDLGLKDWQVPALAEEHLDDDNESVVDGDGVLRYLQLAYNIIHKSTLIMVSAIPIVLLNLPIGVLAGLYSERRRVKALAKSKVKIKGYDVMLTEKVLFCVVMVPTLWIAYGLIMILLTELEGPTIAVLMLSLPLFAYTGIVVVENGVIGWQDLRPNVMRLYPSSRKRLAALPATRKKLQDDVRAFIRRIGPSLGDVYYKKDLDWSAVQEQAAVPPDEDKKRQ